MRRRWLFGVVAGVLLGTAAALLLAGGGAPAPGYTVSTLWRAAWGPAGLRLVRGADGRRYGPLTFGIGRRRVVLADSFARRLWLIPLRGGAPRVVDFGPRAPLIEDLAVARDGTVYMADRDGTLWRWRPGMARPRAVARLGDGADGLVWVEGLSVLRSGEPVVDLLTVTRQRADLGVFVLGPGGGRRRVVGLTLDERSARRAAELSPGAVPAGGHALTVGADGGIYLLGYRPDGERAVYRYDASGRLLSSAPAPGGPGHWSLLGVDRAGRIYLGVELGGPQGRLLVLSRRGRTVMSRALPMPGLVHMGTYVRVGPTGGIYVARPSRDGLDLQVWRRRRRFSLRRP